MTELDWQKSTYSEVASSCIYIATDTTPQAQAHAQPPIHLRESDTPQTILTTTPAPLAALISALKGAARAASPSHLKTPTRRAVTELDWQKSTHSSQASSCIYIATDTTPQGPNPSPNPIHLRESDTPQTILTTTPAPLAALISVLKGAAS